MQITLVNICMSSCVYSVNRFFLSCYHQKHTITIMQVNLESVDPNKEQKPEVFNKHLNLQSCTDFYTHTLFTW